MFLCIFAPLNNSFDFDQTLVSGSVCMSVKVLSKSKKNEVFVLSFSSIRSSRTMHH